MGYSVQYCIAYGECNKPEDTKRKPPEKKDTKKK